jgi:hypothetical protein
MLVKKRGGDIRPRWLLNGFRQAVSDAGLTEVFMKGYPYTWFKSLGTPRAVEVKLDRALANADWFRMFPNVMVENLVAPASDHYPLLLKKEESQRIWVPRQSFKFENAWCVEQGIYDIVSNSWSSSAGMQVTDKLIVCANDLSSWNKANRNGIKQELDDCRRELNRCRNQGAAADPNTLTNLRKRMTHLMIQEDKYWRQRAKTHWYRDGDLNTKFFHASATSRKKVNRINFLENDVGVRVSDEQGMR